MIHAIADKGSTIANTPFLILLALAAAVIGARWLANHLHDNRRRQVEAAMRRHPAGNRRRPPVVDVQAEWDAYLQAVEAKRHQP